MGMMKYFFLLVVSEEVNRDYNYCNIYNKATHSYDVSKDKWKLVESLLLLPTWEVSIKVYCGEELQQ